MGGRVKIGKSMWRSRRSKDLWPLPFQAQDPQTFTHAWATVNGRLITDRLREVEGDRVHSNVPRERSALRHAAENSAHLFDAPCPRPSWRTQMRSIRDHADETLVWTQPRALKRVYELRAGTAVLGSLRWEKAF